MQKKKKKKWIVISGRNDMYLSLWEVEAYGGVNWVGWMEQVLGFSRIWSDGSQRNKEKEKGNIQLKEFISFIKTAGQYSGPINKA